MAAARTGAADGADGVNAAGGVGILGGSFSPPHMGHVLAAHYALMRWSLKRVLVIPSFEHPFGKSLPAFEHRFEMCRLAFEHLGGFARISDIERELGGVSYTVETVRELFRRHPEEKYHLLVGGDILADIPKWREFDELNRLAPMLVVPRIKDGEVLGGEPHEAALPDIDSTLIREMLADGCAEPHGALPAEVLEYIREHGLYRER